MSLELFMQCFEAKKQPHINIQRSGRSITLSLKDKPQRFIRYTFDKDGRLLTREGRNEFDDVGETSISYDSSGRIVEIKDDNYLNL